MQFVKDIADEEVKIDGNEVKHSSSADPKVCPSHFSEFVYFVYS